MRNIIRFVTPRTSERQAFGRSRQSSRLGIKLTLGRLYFQRLRDAQRRDSFSHAYVLSPRARPRRIHVCVRGPTCARRRAAPRRQVCARHLVRSHGKEALPSSTCRQKDRPPPVYRRAFAPPPRGSAPRSALGPGGVRVHGPYGPLSRRGHLAT